MGKAILGGYQDEGILLECKENQTSANNRALMPFASILGEDLSLAQVGVYQSLGITGVMGTQGVAKSCAKTGKRLIKTHSFDDLGGITQNQFF